MRLLKLFEQKKYFKKIFMNFTLKIVVLNEFTPHEISSILKYANSKHFAYMQKRRSDVSFLASAILLLFYKHANIKENSKILEDAIFPTRYQKAAPFPFKTISNFIEEFAKSEGNDFVLQKILTSNNPNFALCSLNVFPNNQEELLNIILTNGTSQHIAYCLTLLPKNQHQKILSFLLDMPTSIYFIKIYISENEEHFFDLIEDSLLRKKDYSSYLECLDYHNASSNSTYFHSKDYPHTQDREFYRYSANKSYFKIKNLNIPILCLKYLKRHYTLISPENEMKIFEMIINSNDYEIIKDLAESSCFYFNEEQQEILNFTLAFLKPAEQQTKKNSTKKKKELTK